MPPPQLNPKPHAFQCLPGPVLQTGVQGERDGRKRLVPSGGRAAQGPPGLREPRWKAGHEHAQTCSQGIPHHSGLKKPCRVPIPRYGAASGTGLGTWIQPSLTPTLKHTCPQQNYILGERRWAPLPAVPPAQVRGRGKSRWSESAGITPQNNSTQALSKFECGLCLLLVT